jgi:hypothetical protein
MDVAMWERCTLTFRCSKIYYSNSILQDHHIPGGYKYGDLALQVGGVSDKTVIGYGSYASLTSERLHCKLQTHPLVREGALHEERKKVIAEQRK